MSSQKLVKHSPCSSKDCRVCNPIKNSPTQQSASEKISQKKISTDKNSVEQMRQKIVDLIQQKPDKTATLLSEWINRPVRTKIQKKA